MMKKMVFSSLALAMMGVCSVQAADTAVTKKSTDGQTIMVNKTALSQATFSDLVRAQLANGAKDSEQLRQAVLDDLILSEALAQEAVKTKVNQNPDVKRALDSQQRKLLAEAYVISQLKANPVTEADERAEYDRQIAMTKEGRNSVEYKTSQIVVKDEQTAKNILDRLKLGEDFTKVAKETSLDRNVAEHGGVLPWSLPDQFIAPMGDVIVNLSAGQLASAPIKTAIGWHIVKLNESRPFQAPSFEEAKQNMMQTLLERRKQDIIQQVMKRTDVKVQ